MSFRRRLDDELVARGLFATKDEALRAVMAGEVSGGGRRFSSAGELVRPDTELHIRGRLGYVGRGGLKLERALDAFEVSPRGLSCLDVGCSTGGFTDCLLKRGAAHVLSVDVGYAQFDWSLRTDGRVELLERTNIVDVPVPERARSIDLAVCDVSFTSVSTVLSAVSQLLKDEGTFITLVKPQFEAPRSEVGQGGVVSDPAVQLAAVDSVSRAFAGEGLLPAGLCESPIRGHKGNREFLLLGVRGGREVPDAIERDDIRTVVYGRTSLT